MEPAISNKSSDVKKILNNYTAEQCFLLYDQNTIQHCDEKIRVLFPELNTAKRIVIPAGDQAKEINKCVTIWNKLLAYNAPKSALMINVGGGMITDIGGFCAATYKRGVAFINIPTSLLGMVDAGIGGKTGVNFENSKNQIGVFADAKFVYYHTDFLLTLPRTEIMSGIAEMIKHELLFNKDALNIIAQRNKKDDWITQEAIRESIEYKLKLVQQDYYDLGFRQCLNFGHTVGHAIEAYSHDLKKPILHGEAVMLGMIEELKLSEQLLGCPQEVRALLENVKQLFFPVLDIHYSLKKILPYMVQDKKNDALIRCSLLNDVATPKIQVAVSVDQIKNILA